MENKRSIYRANVPRVEAYIPEKHTPDQYRFTINHRLGFIYTSFIMEFAEGFIFPGEKHDFWEMVYVIDGKLTVTKDENVYDLKNGDAIFHAPNKFHSFSVKKGDSCQIMIISFSLVSDLTDRLDSGVYKLSDDLHGTLMQCYNRISDGFSVDSTFVKRKFSSYDKLAEGLAAVSFELFLLELISRSEKRTRLDCSQSAENYRLIINTLSNHIRERLTIEQIANYCLMTPSNLKKTFTKYSGMGILKYFNSLKISRAKEMLCHGYTSEYISSYLGYSSPCYFSRAFKNEVGVSPQKYKSSLNCSHCPSH